MTTGAPKPVRFTFSGDSSRLVGSIREIEGALDDQKKAVQEQMAEMRRRSREEAQSLSKLAAARQGNLRDELAAVRKLSTSEAQSLNKRQDLWGQAAAASNKYMEAIKKAEREQRRFKEIGSDTASELAAAEKRARRLARELYRANEPLRGMRRHAELFEDSMRVAARRAKDAIKKDIAQTLKDSLAIPKGAMSLAGAGARSLGGPLSWAAGGGVQQFQEGYIEQSETREMDREGWRQAILGSGFNIQQFNEISKFNRELLKNIPGGETDLYEAQRMIAFETGGNLDLFKRLTQIAADIDAVAPKDDMGDVAEDFRAILTEFEISPDFWLRTGTSQKDFREYEEKFKVMKAVPELEREVADLRAQPEISEEGMQTLREKEAKLALGQQYIAQGVQFQFIEALGKKFEGAASRVASKIPLGYLRGELKLLNSNVGRFFSEWAGSYYSDLGASTSSINDALDNVDSVSDFLGKGKELYASGAFDDEIATVSAMLANAWEDGKTILWAAIEALGGVLSEGWRVGGLYIEDALIGVFRRIPMFGMADAKSELEMAREKKPEERGRALRALGRAFEQGPDSAAGWKVAEAARRYNAMETAGAGREELDEFLFGEAERLTGFRRDKDPGAIGFGGIWDQFARRAGEPTGNLVQFFGEDLYTKTAAQAASAFGKTRVAYDAGLAAKKDQAQAAAMVQASSLPMLATVPGGPIAAAAAGNSNAYEMVRARSDAAAPTPAEASNNSMRDYLRQARDEARRANAARDRRDIRGAEAYN